MFIEESLNRGFVFQSTNLSELKEIMKEKKITAYIGFDATAKSLHVGN